jgi:competence protein ComEC
MAVLGLTAAAGGRRIPGVRLVATAVVLLLLGDPLLVHSVGFRLSVAATLGLVLLAGPLGRLVPGPGWLARPLAVTVAAQAGALPVMAATFGAVSVLAVPANLAAEPAAGAVMTLGLTSGLVAGAAREEVAWVLQAPVRVSVWWVETVASVAAGLSAPPVGVAGWLAVLGGAGVAVALWRARGARALGRCALVAVVPWVALVRPPLPERSEVAVLPGDALAVPRCGSWHLVLGDGGADDRARAEVLEALWAMGLGRVATVAVPEGSGDDLAAPASLASVLGARVVPGPPQAAGGATAGEDPVGGAPVGDGSAGDGSAGELPGACAPARPRSPP